MVSQYLEERIADQAARKCWRVDRDISPASLT
jgi:hypothetical protein